MANKMLQLTPLRKSFVAEVTGLDCSKNFSDSEKKQLRRALSDFQVLLFRGQKLNEEKQVRFAQLFGDCRVMWQSKHYPSQNKLTHYLSNVDLAGKPIGQHPDVHSIYWHSDGSWSHHPPRATVLNAIRVPEGYGKTYFANMYQVYEDLDETSKTRFKELKAEHNFELSRAAREGRLPWQWLQNRPGRPAVSTQIKWWLRLAKRRWREGPVFHPVVRLHPDTGRPVLFIGDHAWRITGKFLSTGIQLMREINKLHFDQEAIYIHEWKQDDLLIWDNGSVLHKVGPYDLVNQTRIIRRCVVMS